MSTQLYDCIDKGFATRILPDEAGTACLGCNNLFSENDKVYMMNKKNGTTIMCSSLDCFKKQGGDIDEYQITTIVARKPKIIKVQKQTQSTSKDKIISEYYRLHEIEDTLLQVEQNQEFSTNGSKLGMYMKMIDDNTKDNICKNCSHTIDV